MKYAIALCALCLVALSAPACDPVVTAGAGLTMGYGTGGCVGAAPALGLAPGCGVGVGRSFAPGYGVGVGAAPVFAPAFAPAYGVGVPVFATSPGVGVTVIGGGRHHHHGGHFRFRGRF